VSENLDLVRSIFAVVVGGPEPRTGTGLAGMAEAMRGVLSVWEDHRIEAADCRELDDERVLVFGRQSGRGKASGLDFVQIRAEATDVFHIRDGKVTKLVTYLDRDRALADLGLEG
jgi:hypothetical protein